MNLEELRSYCLSFPESHEGMPFEGFFNNSHAILVFYVRCKMFCFLDIDKFDSCTIKCSPEKIKDLKEQYQAIGKPYNLSPKYWISVCFNEDIDDALIMKMIKESYVLVSNNLPKL